MNRETFQRYALVALVLLLAAVATQHRRWAPRFHTDRCHVERNVERHVERHVALAPLPPHPPLPPMAPPPPPPPPPPAFAEVDLDRWEADARRMEAEAHRAAEHARRHAEEALRRVEARHRDRHRAPAMMTVASRDEVLYEESFRFRAGDRLTVGLSSEDVRVEVARGSQATVRVIGRGRDARAEFERRRFEARYGDGTLRVRTSPTRQSPRLRSVQAGYTVVIALPVEAQLDVATSSGDVRIERAEGRSASVATSSGDIAVGTLRADRISIAASSGDVSADALDGAVEVATSSGDVRIGWLAGRSASVTSSSGDVSVREASAARFGATTSSGDVEAGGLSAAASVTTSSGDVELTFTRVAAVEAQTGSGSITLVLPRGADADVDLASGDIEIDRALAFDGDRGRRSARGRIGRGGPSLSVSTGSGGIELNAR